MLSFFFLLYFEHINFFHFFPSIDNYNNEGETAAKNLTIKTTEGAVKEEQQGQQQYKEEKRDEGGLGKRGGGGRKEKKKMKGRRGRR